MILGLLSTGHFIREQLPMSNLNRLYARGFTLLELLVVLVLISLIMATVGPRFYRSLDNYRADAEERLLFELLERVSYQSFFKRRAQHLRFVENRILSTEDRIACEFKFIEFPEQHVTWNANGFSQTPRIAYSIQGRPRQAEFQGLEVFLRSL